MGRRDRISGFPVSQVIRIIVFFFFFFLAHRHKIGALGRIYVKTFYVVYGKESMQVQAEFFISYQDEILM